MVSMLLISAVTITSCFATPTIIVLALVGLYALYIAYVRRQYNAIVNPPFKNYFIGNASELVVSNRNRHLLWITWDRSYGPIFKLCILHRVIVMVTSSKYARKLCLNSNYPKAKQSYSPLMKLLGEEFMNNSMLTECDHELWRQHRQAFNPAFYKTNIRMLFPIFNTKSLELVEKIKETDGKSFSLLSYLVKALMDVICEAGFSFESGCLKDDTNSFPAAMNLVLKTTSEVLNDPFFRLKPWNRQQTRNCRAATKLIRKTAEEIIRQKLIKRENPDEPCRDIMDLAIDNIKTYNINLTEKDLVNDFVTLLVAGQETTSNSIAFLFYLLATNAEYKLKAQDEADEFFSNNDDIQFNNLDQLPYIEACWKESLRLYPPGFATIREIPPGLQDFDGYNLPVGTNVAINFIPIHYNSCENGALFNPERSAAACTGDQDELYSFLPFSLGQRSCIGRFFAETEAKIVILRLLRNFDFQVTLDQSFDVDEALTLRLFDGCMLRMTPRV